MGIFPLLAQIKPVFGFVIPHAYRYQTLMDLLGVVIIALALFDYAKKLKKSDWLVAGVAVLFVASYLFPSGYYFRGYVHPDESPRVYDFNAINTTGRALISDSSFIPNPHASYFQFYLQKNKPIVHGLFIEEAELSDLALNYPQMTMRMRTFIWGAMSMPSMNMFYGNYSKAARFYSDLFYVTDMVAPVASYQFESDSSTALLDQTFQAVGDLNSSGVIFRHYRLGNFSLADIRPVEPACTGNWKKFMYTWFDANGTQISYESCKTVQYDKEAAGRASVEVLNYSNGKIDLMVHADSAVPVFVKEAYDPGWKAYSEDGSLTVYRATPAFMEVFGKGRVNLRYEPDANLHLFVLLGAGLLFVVAVPREKVESWFLERKKKR